MSAPEMSTQGRSEDQKTPKAPRNGGQMALAGVRDQMCGGNVHAAT